MVGRGVSLVFKSLSVSVFFSGPGQPRRLLNLPARSQHDTRETLFASVRKDIHVPRIHFICDRRPVGPFSGSQIYKNGLCWGLYGVLYFHARRPHPATS